MTTSARRLVPKPAARFAGAPTRIGLAAWTRFGKSRSTVARDGTMSPDSCACSWLASCECEYRVSARRLDSSLASSGPIEAMWRRSSSTKRSVVDASRSPSWLAIIRDECTMRSNTVVHHARRSSSGAASGLTCRAERSLTSSVRPTFLNSRSSCERAGRFFRTWWSSRRRCRRLSSVSKDAPDRPGPSGVVARTESRAVRSAVTDSKVSMMASRPSGNVGQPSLEDMDFHCLTSRATTVSAPCRSSTCVPGRSRLLISLT